jgi:hypothetical protein
MRPPRHPTARDNAQSRSDLAESVCGIRVLHSSRAFRASEPCSRCLGFARASAPTLSRRAGVRWRGCGRAADIDPREPCSARRWLSSVTMDHQTGRAFDMGGDVCRDSSKKIAVSNAVLGTTGPLRATGCHSELPLPERRARGGLPNSVCFESLGSCRNGADRIRAPRALDAMRRRCHVTPARYRRNTLR